MRKILIALCLFSISLMISAGNIGVDISAGFNSLRELYTARSSYSGGIEADIYNRLNDIFEVGFGAGYSYAYINYYDSISPHNQFLTLFISGKINIYEDFGIFKDDNTFRTIYLSPRAWHRITGDVFEYYPGFTLGVGFNRQMKNYTWGTKYYYHIIISDNIYVPSSIVGVYVTIQF
ncbi:MAG: hypothetical protein SVK54_01645 [candidate division WOR-3 bacterium]|nr:hypothetical protein [candidate division WOR-3 bacterium]